MNRNNNDEKQLRERFANLTGGEIAGIVVGVIVALLIIVLVLLWLTRKSGMKGLPALAPLAADSATSPMNYILTNTL